MDVDLRPSYERRVRDLAGFGHRGSGTEHERRAANYLADELRGLGLEPVMEEFSGCRSLGARLLLHIALAGVGAALLWRIPTLTVLLGLTALGSLVVELTIQRAVLGLVVPGGWSCNVVARVPPRGGGVTRGRLVVCGHYDSQRTGLVWNEAVWSRLAPMLLKLPAGLQSPLLPVPLAMLVQAGVGLAAIAGAGRAFVTIGGVAVLVVYGLAGVLLAEWSVGAPVPGASDNASGASAVVTLGEEFLRAPANGVELVLLLTGCEEIGLLGAAAWADRHRPELRALPTVFLNLDGLGFGPPRFVSQEVPLAGPPRSYPARLLDLGTTVAAEEGIMDVGPYPVPGFTDGLALLVRGIPGITLIGSRPDGRLPHWHQPSDDAERMDFDGAWCGVELASRVMHRLASGV